MNGSERMPEHTTESDAATCPDCGGTFDAPMGDGCKRPWHHADEWGDIIQCQGCACENEHDGDYGAAGHAGPCPPHTRAIPPGSAAS